jgi:hypothetical protein
MGVPGPAVERYRIAAAAVGKVVRCCCGSRRSRRILPLVTLSSRFLLSLDSVCTENRIFFGRSLARGHWEGTRPVSSAKLLGRAGASIFGNRTITKRNEHLNNISLTCHFSLQRSSGSAVSVKRNARADGKLMVAQHVQRDVTRGPGFVPERYFSRLFLLGFPLSTGSRFVAISSRMQYHDSRFSRSVSFVFDLFYIWRAPLA